MPLATTDGNENCVWWRDFSEVSVAARGMGAQEDLRTGRCGEGRSGTAHSLRMKVKSPDLC
ncbi:hypothetical protein CA54_51810 [Symmachiella macrocystis]|uniref:Uncharacterized protein n=1 Tax=Symmachiella macrocystis TaxID=2527985 RepID=A0A5C6B5E0_9PLAN|nr:hypothetical protein CA54_51810 [Symmachiella macrocystis]